MIPNGLAPEIICVDNRTFREWGNQGYYNVSLEGILEESLAWLWWNKVQPILVTAKKNPGLAYEIAKKHGYEIPALVPDEENILEAQTRPIELKPIIKEVSLDNWDNEDEVWKPVVISEETHHPSGRKKRSDAGKKRGAYGPRKNKKA